MGIWGLGSMVVPGCGAPFWGTNSPKQRAISMVPSTAGPRTPALPFTTLSSDSLTTASWHRPHPDSSRQSVQDTGPGREQGVTGSGAGPLGPRRQWAGAVWRAERSAFLRRAFPGPLSQPDDPGRQPGALKPAFPGAGRILIGLCFRHPSPARAGTCVSQSRKWL